LTLVKQQAHRVEASLVKEKQQSSVTAGNVSPFQFQVIWGQVN
jgi:hypothetical protein